MKKRLNKKVPSRGGKFCSESVLGKMSKKGAVVRGIGGKRGLRGIWSCGEKRGSTRWGRSPPKEFWGNQSSKKGGKKGGPLKREEEREFDPYLLQKGDKEKKSEDDPLCLKEMERKSSWTLAGRESVCQESSRLSRQREEKCARGLRKGQ